MRAKQMLTTDAIVLSLLGEKDLSILTVKRKSEPYKGRCALPGGFVEENEKNFEACLRELEEETTLIPSWKQFLQSGHIYDRAGRDPRGHVISIPYICFITPEMMRSARPQDDAEDLVILNTSPTPPELAFDHGTILYESLKYIEFLSTVSIAWCARVASFIFDNCFTERQFRTLVSRLQNRDPIKKSTFGHRVDELIGKSVLKKNGSTIVGKKHHKAATYCTGFEMESLPLIPEFYTKFG